MAGEEESDKKVVSTAGITAGGNVTFGDISGQVAIGKFANVIQHIAAVYNIHPPTDGGSRITASLKDLLRNLLERHILFGGRDAELTRLNSFLTHLQSGYLFVTGLSGFGKTALLANWVKILELDDRKVCYHFISRIDDVADEDFALRNLCQQLVSYHDLRGVLPMSTAELRALFPQLLKIPSAKGERLVVILDGLDEAVGWIPGPTLFPRSLPEGVFIVLSARDMADLDWLTKLGLSHDTVDILHLEAMRTNEIANLLQKTGGKAALLSSNAEFIKAMHTVSQGDPFYLHFLIEDIQEGDNMLDNIKSHLVGLDAYLGEWWNQLLNDVEINRQEIYDLLAILMVAKGPLGVLDLAGISSNLARGALLNKELSGRLRRYLIGDRKSGYALCHPRFGEYLMREIFNEEEVQSYRQQLLSYCSRWQENRSDYALAHYAGHLVEAGSTDELYKLINESFMHKKQARFGSHLSFAADVKLAIEAARSEKNLIQEIHGVLIYATLRSLATNVPPEVLDLLTRLDQDTRAQDLASLIVNKDLQSQAYYSIGVALLYRKEIVKAKGVFLQALASVEKIEDEYRQAEVFGEIAEAMAQLGELDQVLAKTEKIKDNHNKVKALIGIAKVMAQLGEKAKAIEIVNQATTIAEKIENLDSKPKEQIEIAEVWFEVMVQLGEFSSPLAAAEEIEDLNSRAKMLCKIAKAMAQLGKFNQAINQAMALAEKIKDDYKAEVLGEIAETTAQLGENAKAIEIAYQAINQAMAVAEKIKDDYRAEVLGEIAETMAQLGEKAKAIEIAYQAVIIAEMMKDEYRTVRVMSRIVEIMSQLGEKARAIEIANQAAAVAENIKDKDSNPCVVVYLAKEEVEKVAKEVVREKIENEYREVQLLSSKVQALVKVAKVMAQLGEKVRAIEIVNQAAAVAENIKDKDSRAQVMGGIAEVTAQFREFNLAIAVAKKIEDDNRKAEAFGKIAKVMVQLEEKARAIEVVNQAATVAERINYEGSKEEVLGKIAKVMAQLGKFNQAMVVAEKIKDKNNKAYVFGGIAEVMVQTGEFNLAVAIAEMIEDIYGKTEVFGKITDAMAQLKKRVIAIEITNQTAKGDEEINYERNKMEVSGKIAKVIAQLEEKARTIEIADQATAGIETIEDEYRKVKVVSKIAKIMAQWGKFNQAMAVVEKIKDAGSKANVLGEIAEVMAQWGKFNQAMAVAEKIKDDHRKTQVMSGIAEVMAQWGKFNQAMAVAERLRDEYIETQLLSKIAKIMAQLGKFNLALAVAKMINYENGKAFVLGKIAEIMAQFGNFNLALAVAEKIDYKDSREDVFGKIAEVMAQFGKFNLALAVAEKIDYKDSREDVIGKIDEVTAQLEEFDRDYLSFQWLALCPATAPLGEFNQDMAVAEKIKNEHRRAYVFGKIAEVTAPLGEFKQNMAVAEKIDYEYGYGKEYILGKIAEATAQLGKFNQAVAVAEMIKDSNSKAKKLCKIVEVTAQLGEKSKVAEIANRAVAAIVTIKDKESKGDALNRIGQAMIQTGEKASEQTLSIIRDEFAVAQNAGLQEVFETLENWSSFIASVDQGQTLWKVYEATVEVDSWWDTQ